MSKVSFHNREEEEGHDEGLVQLVCGADSSVPPYSVMAVVAVVVEILRRTSADCRRRPWRSLFPGTSSFVPQGVRSPENVAEVLSAPHVVQGRNIQELLVTHVGVSHQDAENSCLGYSIVLGLSEHKP